MGDNVFSLRLNSLERKALERLARVYDISQNQLIAELITEEYAKIDNCCEIVLGKLESIAAREIDLFTRLCQEFDNIRISLEDEKGKYREDELEDELKEISKMIYRQGKYIEETTDLLEDGKELDKGDAAMVGDYLLEAKKILTD